MSYSKRFYIVVKTAEYRLGGPEGQLHTFKSVAHVGFNTVDGANNYIRWALKQDNEFYKTHSKPESYSYTFEAVTVFDDDYVIGSDNEN